MLARAIASGLESHPEWIAMARGNLDRWEARNAHSHGLVRCYREWRELLDQPTERIRAILKEESEEATRLRQNSPFAGALTPEEVWRIKERCRNETIGT